MIELERHIEILLLNNDCVIVPGLGGFMAYHVEARYDLRDSMFLPPLRALGFNPQLTSLNDSLLAQSYVEAYDISYPEATRRIEAEVAEVKEILDATGSYELHDIGTLYINKEGKLEYEPCEAGILSPSLYGLNAFEMKRLTTDAEETATSHHIETKTKHEKAIENPTVDLPSAAAPQEGEQDTVINTEDDDKEATIHIKVSWIRNFAATAAAVIAFFLLSVPVKNSNPDVAISKSPNETILELMSTAQVITQHSHQDVAADAKETLPVAEDVVLENIEPMPTEGVKHETEVHPNQAKEQKAEETKPEVSVTAETNSKSYCIVLASRVTQANAQIFIDKLKKKGIDSVNIYTHNKINRVVYGAYSTESDAQEALRKLRMHDEFEQAWVYQKK